MRTSNQDLTRPGRLGVVGARLSWCLLASFTQRPPTARIRTVGCEHLCSRLTLAHLSESRQSPVTGLANSALLKASFCGVLRLECAGSWRRDAGAARVDFSPAAAIRPAQTTTPPCRSCRTFICQPMDRSTRTPHGTQQTMQRIALDPSARRSSGIAVCWRVLTLPGA